MTQRVGGFRRKTRHKLRKSIRQKGKISLRRFFHTYVEGDHVSLSAEPSQHFGMYFPRFHGKTGVITKKQGTHYYVEIYDGGKKKHLLVHPVHLKNVKPRTP